LLLHRDRIPACTDCIAATSLLSRLSFKSPLILPSHLLLFFWRKIILDIERLTNLFGGLALYHVGDGQTRQVEQRLDIQIICSENELKKSSLIDLAKVCVPRFESVVGFGRFLGILAVLAGGAGVLFAILYHLGQDFAANVGNGDVFALPDICVEGELLEWRRSKRVWVW
jgi:hypothetical protein